MTGGMISDAAAMAPEAVMFLGALSVLVGGSFTPRTSQWKMRGLAALTALISIGLSAYGLTREPLAAFTGTFSVDNVTGASRLVVGAAVLIVLALGADEMAGHARESETYALILIGATGAQLLAGTTDLTLLIAAFFLSSIPLYGLIGIVARKSSAEAALKTYLLGALLGIMMMLGVTVLVSVIGGSGYSALHNATALTAVTAGAVLVMAGLLFESGAVPGHYWVPDGAQGGSATAAAFLTTIPKIGGLVATARFVAALPENGVREWAVLLGVLAGVSMTVGNLAAYPQTDPRRLLGWSSVSQVGYLLVPAAVATTSSLAAPSLLFYLAGYALSNLGAFAVSAALPRRRELSDYGGLARQHPLLAGALVVVLLSLVGTPPTAVFVGKLTVTAAAWDGGLAWLAVLVLVNSMLSLFYYLRWIAPMFAFGSEQATSEADAALQPWAAYTSVVTAVLVLGFGAGAALFWDQISAARFG